MSHTAQRAQMYERRALEAAAIQRAQPVGRFMDKSNWHLQSKARRYPVPTVLNTSTSFAAWTTVPAVGSPDPHIWGGMDDVDRPGKRQLKEGRSEEYDPCGLIGMLYTLSSL